MVHTERIVAVGFLTSRDLAVLGDRFDRAFPIASDDAFRDLIDRLDEIEVETAGNGVLLRRGS